MNEGRSGSTEKMHKQHYGRLVLMTVLSFISMYALMYSMVDRFSNVYSSFNQLYMAGLMTAAMVLIEISVMSSMYENRRVNAFIFVISIVALAAFFMFIRQQTAISDRQFLKSMIPHHAGAILMCQQSVIEDAEIKELCKGIISSQQAEIDQMKRKLDALK